MDYPDAERLRIRYDELAKLLRAPGRFSLLDYGCGFGAFYDYLKERRFDCDYTGYDISEAMIAAAAAEHPGQEERFVLELAPDAVFDYVIESGTFNLRVGNEIPTWEKLVHEALDEFDRRSRRGFAFNMLTAYRDEYHKLERNYYGNPLHYFDLCLRKYAPNVALAHDYDLWDFTIIVRKMLP
ncbi:MAG: class I SAM-dependent methyltransferase [Candidatus Eremiobacteraeota bacterium]|nr:class I SAM-dependent methyltransferase [Candidatus Eremiobacteraeota bacterium]